MSEPPNSTPKISIDSVGKALAMLITLVGIYAWVGGEAYLLGYWNTFGWDGPIIKLSIHETAFFGFIRPFTNWVGMVAFAVALGGYGLLMDFWSSRGTIEQLPRQLSKFEIWFKRGKKMDAIGKVLFGGAIIAGLIFGSLVLIPLLVWVSSAITAGRSAALAEVCDARKTQAFSSTVLLADGSEISGRFLERSDKLSVLLGRTHVYVVSISDNPKLLDKTAIGHITCTATK